MATEFDIEIRRGDTWRQVFRWEQEGWMAVAIESITRGAFVQITLAEEVEIPNGWRVAIVDAQGMTDLNAEIDERTLAPRERSLRRAKVIDGTTIELNGISSGSFRPYRAGGYLVWHPPVDLSGYEARMSMKDRYGGTLLVPQLTTELGTLEIDPDAATTTGILSDAITAAMAKGGVYDLEMVSGAGVVTKTFFGAVGILGEVTTTITP